MTTPEQRQKPKPEVATGVVGYFPMPKAKALLSSYIATLTAVIGKFGKLLYSYSTDN